MMKVHLAPETGLYYYGARYLDPKYSMWLSTDPALSDYIPAAGTAAGHFVADMLPYYLTGCKNERNQ